MFSSTCLAQFCQLRLLLYIRGPGVSYGPRCPWLLVRVPGAPGCQLGVSGPPDRHLGALGPPGYRLGGMPLVVS